MVGRIACGDILVARAIGDFAGNRRSGMLCAMSRLEPGQFVTVTQQIPHQRADWTTSVTGEVVKVEQKKTGSWFAHAKDDKLWLDRLTLRKDDGEIVDLILDQFTHIEHLPPPEATEATATPDVSEEAVEEESSAEQAAGDEAEAQEQEAQTP